MAKIDSYKFGHIVIDGKPYDYDLFILPDGTVEDRKPSKGKHKITAREVARLRDLPADVVTIGTGAYGNAGLTGKATKFLKESGFTPRVLHSPQAVDEFNHATDEGKRVAALMHITC